MISFYPHKSEKAQKNSTRRGALLLARATLIKSALQLLTPLALVRLIDQSEFGEYRLFWLVANTATMLLPLGMDRSLLFFVPKAPSDEERLRFLSQTVLFFLGISIVAGTAIALGEFWLPESVVNLTDPPVILAAFSAVWLLSTPIQTLPNADQDILWQSRSIIIIALLRVVTVVCVAWVTRDIRYVFLGLLAWAVFQLVLLTYYIKTRYGLRMGLPTIKGLREQMSFAVPLGLAQTLSSARWQAEQWIVALLFSTTSLALFAIGVSFNVILSLARSSVRNVILPKMSISHASGDTTKAHELNNKANIAVFTVVTPSIVLLWTFATEAVSVLYTPDYLGAVPVLRVYLISLLLMSVESSTILMLFQQGRFVLTVSSSILLITLPLSYLGGVVFGLTGVAIGSLAGEMIGRSVNFRRAAKLLGIRVSKLHDWLTLAKILIASVIAAAIARYVSVGTFDANQTFMRLTVGALLYLTCYVPLLFALRLSWLIRAMLGKEQWK